MSLVFGQHISPCGDGRPRPSKRPRCTGPQRIQHPPHQPRVIPSPRQVASPLFKFCHSEHAQSAGEEPAFWDGSSAPPRPSPHPPAITGRPQPKPTRAVRCLSPAVLRFVFLDLVVMTQSYTPFRHDDGFLQEHYARKSFSLTAPIPKPKPDPETHGSPTPPDRATRCAAPACRPRAVLGSWRSAGSAR
jgi:hypothetical protein